METNWAALEGVRGILALTVLGIHTLEKDSNFQIAINHAVSPVSIFIILSGFSCARGYAYELELPKHPKILQKKKIKANSSCILIFHLNKDIVCTCNQSKYIFR